MPSTSRTSRKPLAQLPLRGAGGEPILFANTIASHGCASLAPAVVSPEYSWYRTALRIGSRVVPVTLTDAGTQVTIASDIRVTAAQSAEIVAQVARMFRFEDDLSAFYRAIASDAQLQWAAGGAGRLLASPSVFEDVIKTICTTNCAWSATVRMTAALVELGEGAFPRPELVATTGARWFTDVARMGYRGPYVAAIAREVANGRIDLEQLRPKCGMPDEDVASALLALPGIGPYAAAHTMQLLGRHRQLILDSWTRPTYLARSGKRRATDTAIRRRFAGYGEYAGLAFWLYLTRDWVPDRTHP
ncbi:MAG: DNA-3-methyladenine glycosylase family protein [Vulcanimicrobiaceae bacterium]